MIWNEANLKAVAIQTIGNGLWLGTLAWLVVGLWLDLVGFMPCWLGATIISWLLAIQRKAGSDILGNEVLSALKEIEKETGISIPDPTIRDILEEVTARLGSGQEYSNTLDLKNQVLYAVRTVAVSQLIYGDFHIYRGTLNDAGNRLVRLHEYASDQLVSTGELRQHEAEEEANRFRDLIRTAG